MTFGKRKQPTRLTATPVGLIRPSAGIQPSHAGAALRFTARLADLPPILDSTPHAPSTGHLRRAARLLIGCARRAGMGSIRAVAGTTRALVTWALRREGDVDVAATARASVAAARRAERDLTLNRQEAATAAAMAAIEAARQAGPDSAALVRRAVASATAR